MILKPIHCSNCDGVEVIKHGKIRDSKQQYFCQNPKCHRHTFYFTPIQND
ncbi:IS1/IS1595 family N-terminal zinc-binding domain-containing protein [Chroococcidiopsis sp.]